MHKFVINMYILFIFLLIQTSFIFSATTKIEGYIKDVSTNQPLIGANIVLVGTSFGAATNMEGKFVILNPSAGSYIMRVSYIGYNSQDLRITIKEGYVIKQDFYLVPVTIEEKTVEITAQASGQTQAINQELSSDQITNVVSADKIRELPDANAAESVGRIPGVSILRNGGEGSKIVVRGLAPKFNKIMIDGVQLASSVASDRSTDLSMISSYMLDGIQVSKSVTADMDPDVLGGTINFELREAKPQEDKKPKYNLLLQGGYDALTNAYHKFRNYKSVISVEDRFFDNKFGVFVQFDAERKNLTSNEMGATYTNNGNSITEYLTTGLRLFNIPRDRIRYNGAFVVDYKLGDSKLKLTNFISSGTTNSIAREENFSILSNARNFNLSNYKTNLNILNNAIDFEYQLSTFKILAKISHSYSETKNPDNWTVSFLQTSAGINSFSNVSNLDPRDIPKAVNNDLSTTYLNTVQTSKNFSRERSLTASLDLETSFNLGNYITTKIKFGGKYRYQNRSMDIDYFDGQSLISGSAGFVDNLINEHFSFPQTTSIPISLFLDDNYKYGKFLDGDYNMAFPLDYNTLTDLAQLLEGNADYIAENNGNVSYGHNNGSSTTNDYSGNEKQAGFYIMPVINIGSQVKINTGLRYQHIRTEYTASRGIQSVESWYEYNHYDTTTVQSHQYFLPSLIVKYKPLAWFDIRLSYSNTLAYPDYNSIIPRINMTSFGIQYVNYKLIPSTSKNYDIYLSFYNNSIGLITVGGFLKQIDNLIYPWTFYASGEDAKQYMPLSLINNYNSKNNYQITTYVNNNNKINDYGLETDWQTHLWYLPEPFSGIVFSANYTHIFSKAKYPFTITKISGRKKVYIDTTFTARLLYQPDDIVNLSLGFDYKDFSIRVSMIYQADIFTQPNFWPQLRAHTAAYTRWDVAFKQKLPWVGMQVLGNINNINAAHDVSVIKGGGIPISMQDYGMTGNLGIQFQL